MVETVTAIRKQDGINRTTCDRVAGVLILRAWTFSACASFLECNDYK